MHSKAWRRVALAVAAAMLILGSIHLDRAVATPRSPRDRMLAALGSAHAGGGAMIVGSPVVAHSSTQSLSKLAASSSAVAGKVHPVRPLLKASRGSAPQAASDPAVQSQVGPAAMPAPIHTFDGVANTDNPSQVLPPDPTGDVGPHHYIQSVNDSFAIYDKTGHLLLGPVLNNIFWNNFPNDPCATTFYSDPTVLYDHLADRWILSLPAWPNFPQNKGPYYQCFAISKTADPLGSYWLYSFKISDTELHDYPKLGVWPDGYYMSVNQFTYDSSSQLQWSYPAVFVFERDQMLNGATSRWISYNYDNNVPWGGMLPADLDGPAPPAGTPNYFVEVDDGQFVPLDDALYMWQFHVDWQNPNNSTYGENGVPNAVIPTASFNLLPCELAQETACIPQKGTSQKVDAFSDRLMQRLQYRNYGDHQSLVVNHTVDAGGGRAGVRWYEIRDPNGSPSIHQQGTFGPLGAHRWMGSAAMDRQGNMAVGYSISSTSMYPSIAYAGRLISDPLGTFGQGEATLMAGGGSQTSTFARWGDYTMLAVDPTDDCTFWYTNEYFSVTSLQSWKTRIGTFRFPSCTGAPTGHLFGTVTRSSNGTPLNNATVRAGTKTVVTNAAGVYQLFNLPTGSYSLSVSALGYVTKIINGVAVSDRGTTTKDVALDVAAAPTPGKGYLPLVQRPLPPTPTPTPPPSPTPTPTCDPYEPNDNRATNPYGPLVSNQTYQAKLCSGDIEDNYFFVTMTQDQIQITLHLPPTLVSKTNLYIYDRNDLRQSHDICQAVTGTIVKADTTILCSIPHAGAYVIRLYTDPSTVFDNVNPYTFQVSFQ
jgi:hypothetical protein